jgi:cytosine/adenosine deaminase-related metal-dependent hydrolase
VVERLLRHGLVGARTLLVHGVQLSEAEALRAQDAGAWLVHCPRSNMNNGVGHAPTAAFRRAALGTDGLDADMLAEVRVAFLRMRDAGRADAMSAALGMLAGGHRLAAEFIGLPFGQLTPGAPADLVVLDYRPPTPLSADNLAGHLLFGVDRSHVRSTMVAGRFVLRDRHVTTVDEADVRARACAASVALWRRMTSL